MIVRTYIESDYIHIVEEVAFYDNILLLGTEGYIKCFDLTMLKIEDQIKKDNIQFQEIIIEDIPESAMFEIDLEYTNKSSVYEKKSYML
jgi:uncharacterized protein (DUF2344 family)